MFKTMSYNLKEVARLFKQNRVLELRGLSNRLVREAAMEENYAKAELGVIAYALHKLETKEHIAKSQKWRAVKQIISVDLERAEYAASQNDIKLLMQKLKSIIKHIRDTDSELGNFAQNIYEKAKVKQASLAYSYGLSIAQSADLMGADKKDLQSYVGFTKMSDEDSEQKSILTRVKELGEWLNA